MYNKLRRYYSILSDKIAFGRWPGPGLKGSPVPEGFMKDLVDDGVMLIVNLVQDIEMASKEGYLLDYDSEIPRINIQTLDGSILSDDTVMNLVNELIDKDIFPIYINCRGGHGRSAVVAGLIYSYYYQIKAEQVLKDVNNSHLNRLIMKYKWRVFGSPQTNVQKDQIKRLSFLS